MKRDKLKISKQHLTWGVLLLVLAIALMIVFPFITGIVSAYVLAFLLYPLFKKFNKKFNKTISALLCIFILLVLIIVPLFFIVSQVIQETIILSENINFTNVSLGFNGIIEERVFPELTSYLTNAMGDIIQSFPFVLITLLVTFFGIFYILYDWEKLNSFLYRKIPFYNKDELFKDVSKTTKRITYGLLLVGAIEFTIAFVGFTISGVKFSLLLALMIGILAFTLVLDPAVIWMPTALIYLFALNNPGTAIGVIITGLILTTDTIFRPRIVGGVSKINPFLMLLGVLGGIALFGVLGFIIGPIVLFFSIRLFRESFEIVE